VNDPYDEPSDPELMLDTEAHTPEESASLVVAELERLGLVSIEVSA
jgi:adenylylsulfate kinase-like enzyme